VQSAKLWISITGLNFFVQTLMVGGAKGKNPTGHYKQDNSWLMHMLHRSGIKTSNRLCSICVIQHQGL
jgi:hypothetical protein